MIFKNLISLKDYLQPTPAPSAAAVRNHSPPTINLGGKWLRNGVWGGLEVIMSNRK